MDYIYMLISLVLVLTAMKLAFIEMEGRAAKKRINIKWYLQYAGDFVYGRTNNIIIISIFCYVVASNQTLFSVNWMVELLGFIAVGAVVDIVSQYLAYRYVKIRFRKDTMRAINIKQKIEAAIQSIQEEEITYSVGQYDMYEISGQYMNDDKHTAIISVDGGEFASLYRKLPPITYLVDVRKEVAEDKFYDTDVKVTTYTADGKMPFKDDRIDVVVNELSNYDKYELYRILKPGGYAIIEQMGSDNYKEIMPMFIPIRMKGRWDMKNCLQTLVDIGFQNCQNSQEDYGYIRFHTIGGVLQFIGKLSYDKIENYEMYLNIYADILDKIESNGHFDLTTHKFVVTVEKPII